MTEKSSEINWKKDFCEKYFDKNSWELDVLNYVDILLKDKNGHSLLYIESKYMITSETSRRQALSQIILTNKKQDAPLTHVAICYQDAFKNDILELIDCSEDSVMYNNDINWKAEKASSPTKDAVNRINDRISGRITRYANDEIREFYSVFKNGATTTIEITENNFNVVYNSWKNEIKFKEDVLNEQVAINLFLVDMLNGTTYKNDLCRHDDPAQHQDSAKKEVASQNQTLLPFSDYNLPVIREGIDLGNYQIMYKKNLDNDGIKYMGGRVSFYYTLDNIEKHDFFWKKYKRPPEKQEFLKILERSATLYSDKYRKDTGGEYTPTCFVEKQNEILAKHYNLNEFIVFDPCAGVGNLENQFGFEFKENVFLSTLEKTDVDICKIKGFEYAVQFDYLKNKEQPCWNYKGYHLTIDEICRKENKKLMVIMNPPYQNKKEYKYDMAIEFFRKVTELKPDVIVYYCKTEFLLRDTVTVFSDSKYNIVSHIFSNAKDTFHLSEWSVSQIIFDRKNGEKINPEKIDADRYDYDKKTDKLNYVKSYSYDNSRPNLIKEIEKEIKSNANGIVLGQWTNQNYCLVLSGRKDHPEKAITTQNLKQCLLLKGINFNTHGKFFETSTLTYKGKIEEIPDELFNDAIMFSLFYIGCNFTNKGQKNFIMPFTHKELGCAKNNLNVLIPDFEEQTDVFSGCAASRHSFDFREFLTQFTFSAEAKNLYAAGLEIFRYYHNNPEYQNKDWNDSFYDITNAIMGKNPDNFISLNTESDTRVTKVKTTKGSKGFGRNTIKFAVSDEYMKIFTDFFDKRDALAQKINDELVAAGLLLWHRENIY